MSTRSSCVRFRAWLLAVAALAACRGDANDGPRKGRDGGARRGAARAGAEAAPTMAGRPELAAFAREVGDAVAAGDSAALQARLLDPSLLLRCDIVRPRQGLALAPSEIESTLAAGRERVIALTGGPRRLVGVTQRVRARLRMMGGRIEGSGCPVDARSRITVAVAPSSPPPDVVEHRFDALFAGDRWWLWSVQRFERDCSPLATPEALGCRMLRAGGAVEDDAPDDDREP